MNTNHSSRRLYKNFDRYIELWLKRIEEEVTTAAILSVKDRNKFIKSKLGPMPKYIYIVTFSIKDRKKILNAIRKFRDAHMKIHELLEPFEFHY